MNPGGGTVVGTIQYNAVINTAGLAASANQANATVGNMANQGGANMVKFGAVAGAAMGATMKLIDGVVGLMGDAVKRTDTLNNSTRVFQNMGFTADATKTMMDALQKSIQGLPTPLDAAVQGVQMFALSTGNLEKSQQIFSAVNNGIIAAGGSSANLQTAVQQMSQAFANGKIDAETWNSMMDNGLGPTLNMIAKQMGITTGQLKTGLSEGKISVDQFNDALIGLNTKGAPGMASLSQMAKDATGGIGTGFENAKTAVVRGLSEILKALGTGDISATITNLGKAMETALKGIASVVGVIRDVITWLKDNMIVVAIVGGMIGAILVAAFVSWAVAAGAAAIATLAATWPLLVIGAAVGALAYLIITNWDTIKGVISSFWDWLTSTASATWNAVTGFFSAAWEAIKMIWGFYWGFYSAIWEGIKSIFSSVGSWFSSKFNEAVNGIKAAWSGISGFFSGIWEGIKSVFSGVGNWFTSQFQGAANGVKAVFNAIAGYWNRTIGSVSFKAPDWVPGVGGKGFSFPKMPQLAKGGIVMPTPGGTIAQIAEAGQPEAVIPLNKLDTMLNGNGGHDIENNIGTININNRADADYVLAKLTRDDELLSNGVIPVTEYART